MSGWRFLLGNVLQRAALPPVAHSGSTADSLAPLSNWRDGKSQAPGVFVHNVSGVYEADLDLNALLYTSEALDAPFGWRDLIYTYSRTAGLPSNPVIYSTGVFGFKRPSFQEWVVFAGETWKIKADDVLADFPSGTAAVKLQEVVTGQWYDGSAWSDADADLLTLAATENAALDVTVIPNAALLGRGIYRLIVTLDGAWDFTRKVSVDTPLAYPQITAAAMVSANIPAGSTVVLALSGGPSWSLTARRPSFYAIDQTAGLGRLWTLTVTHPAGTGPVAAPPGIGEVFLGLSRTFQECASFPFDMKPSDPSQIRLAGSFGSTEFLSPSERPLRSTTLRFTKSAGKEAMYQQAWNLLYLGTRQGVEPIVLMPEITDPGEVLFGHLKSDVAFSRTTNTYRTFELTLDEMPFAALP